MEFFDRVSSRPPSERAGPLRDHLHYDDATRAHYRREAEKRMGYRSEEQAYTDKRQATGFENRGPVAFGKYEVGRSSMPGNREDDGKAVFADTMKRGIVHQHMDGYGGDPSGDPGAYNPFQFSEIRYTSQFTHNRSKAPFGTKAPRTLKLHLTGKDNPHGPGAYDADKAAKALYGLTDHNQSVFRSETPQREIHSTSNPPPNHYTPKMESVYQNVRDGGASMRGQPGAISGDEASGSCGRRPEHDGCQHRTRGVRRAPLQHNCHDSRPKCLPIESVAPGFWHHVSAARFALWAKGPLTGTRCVSTAGMGRQVHQGRGDCHASTPGALRFCCECPTKGKVRGEAAERGEAEGSEKAGARRGGRRPI